jgi:hypothetical protein
MHRELFDEDFPTLRVVPPFEIASKVPVLVAEADDIPPSGLDHREGFMLSLIDGESTVEDLLDVCAMPADEALRVLLSLVDRSIVALT